MFGRVGVMHKRAESMSATAAWIVPYPAAPASTDVALNPTPSARSPR